MLLLLLLLLLLLVLLPQCYCYYCHCYCCCCRCYCFCYYPRHRISVMSLFHLALDVVPGCQQEQTKVGRVARVLGLILHLPPLMITKHTPQSCLCLPSVGHFSTPSTRFRIRPTNLPFFPVLRDAFFASSRSDVPPKSPTAPFNP